MNACVNCKLFHADFVEKGKDAEFRSIPNQQATERGKGLVSSRLECFDSIRDHDNCMYVPGWLLMLTPAPVWIHL